MKLRQNTFKRAFGAWDQEDDADELVSTIRGSRLFNRETEEL